MQCITLPRRCVAQRGKMSYNSHWAWNTFQRRSRFNFRSDRINCVGIISVHAVWWICPGGLVPDTRTRTHTHTHSWNATSDPSFVTARVFFSLRQLEDNLLDTSASSDSVWRHRYWGETAALRFAASLLRRLLLLLGDWSFVVSFLAHPLFRLPSSCLSPSPPVMLAAINFRYSNTTEPTYCDRRFFVG